jgi:predicted dehydrogenase
VDTIRIALVGLGPRGLHWLRILVGMPGYRIVALCDPIAALHGRALALLNDPREVTCTTRYGDVLSDKRVDAVALCVRCREQGALAAQALEAGKHVHAEVPAAHTIEDCWRIVLAAERSGCLYHLAEQTRYWGFVEAWRDLVAQGRLGQITFCEGQYLGYYGTRQFFQDPATGEFCAVEELGAHPAARPTWLHRMPPIHYLPHELSPMLKVLDDRVTQVVAMSTPSPSLSHPEIAQPDVQVALMKTEKGAVMRMLAGFTQPRPHGDHHWYHIVGTRGSLEWRRGGRDRPRFWLADGQMFDLAQADWRTERTDAPPEARASGHGDADYYVHAAFRAALLEGTPPELDVYRAIETAAPAIMAADSIAQGSRLLAVPDFRPGAVRQPTQPPAARVAPAAEQ